MKIPRRNGFRKSEINPWSQQQIRPDSRVVTDGLWAFTGLADAGIAHASIVTGGGANRMEIRDGNTGVSLEQYRLIHAAANFASFLLFVSAS